MPPSTNRQTLTINGSGFVSGATLTFDPPTGSNVNSNSSYLTFVSSSKIQYEINNAGDTGTWQVRVNNPDGQSSSYKSFTVAAAIPAPTISSLSPTTMPGSTSRQTLTINGSNFVSGATLTFDPPTGSNINSSSGYLSFVSSSQIRYEINNDGDAGTWQVRVNNPDGQSSSYKSFTVTASTPAPSISTVSPTTMPGSTSRQTLTINGSNFVSGATLTFNPPTGSDINSNSGYLTFVSSSQIRYEIDNDGDAGTWQVRVNNPDGQSSSYKSFTVTAITPAPSISSVNPTTMPGSTSRQTLTINGSNFVSGATLTFNPPTGSDINSSSGYLTFVSSSQIRYEIDNDGDAGTWQVRVNNPDGQSSSYKSFTVTAITPAPSISSVNPTTMPASTSRQTLTINGSKFTSGATLTFDPPTGVNIESSSTYLTFVSSSQIRYEINNDGDAGPWQVRVNNPDGQTSGYAAFTVTASTPAPSISSISPTIMPGSTSRQTLTINGSNFTSGATLTFDPPTGVNIESNSTYLTFVSSSQIRYEINNDGDAGPWQVRVNNPDGQTSGYAAFTVTASTPAPSISSISPTTMPGSTSRQTLTINGSNFTSGATLTFDPPTGVNIESSSSYLTFVSSSQIRYEINNDGDAGTWQVRVNNPDGQTSGYAAFTVTASTPAPSISSISPNTMPGSTSRQTLTINGSNFVSGATLTFDPPTGSNINSNSSYLTFVSSSQIRYEINNDGDAGTWQVRVNNPDGQSSANVGFTVQTAVGAPIISTITPDPVSGLNGIQTITLNGSNFVSGCQVTLRDLTTGDGPYIKSTTLISGSQIRVFANFTNNSAQWSAQVTSPTASNIKTFQVNAVASLSSPSIQSVNGDSPVIGSNTPQWIDISGTGFIATPTVVLNWNVEPPTGGAYTLPSTQVQLVSSTLLRISITTTIVPDTWTIHLVNPDGASSNTKSFPVTVPSSSGNNTPSSGWANQFRMDSGSTIPLGGAIPPGVNVNFKATISDPDDDNVKIEVELRKLPASFTGVATHSSGYVTSGFQAVTAAATGLAAGNYGWKYRIVDNRGAAGRWSSVGTPDFIVTSGFPPQGELSSISASWYPSGNYDARPIGQTIDAIVIHTTEGSYSSSLAELTNTAVTKSAHFIVDTDGSIVQLVMLSDRAWHANYYNDRSIGIEVVGYSSQASTWNEAVRGSLVNLVAALAKEYGIPVVHPGGNASTYPSLLFDEPGIVGHNQIQPGGNGYSFRSDPGQYFDWNGLIADVQSRIGGETPQKPAIYSVTQPIQSKNASQDFEIIGTGFAENCQVTLEDLTTGEHPFDNRKVFARDPDGNRLLLRPNFGSDSINHNWVVRVKNPGTVWSQDFPFVVTAAPPPSISGTAFLSFPLSGFDPYSCPISAVFDHSMTERFSEDGIVTTFNGEVATLANGFRRSGGGRFLESIANYQGLSGSSGAVLEYDGHPGIDYSVNNRSVYAAHQGTVIKVNSDPNNDAGIYVRILDEGGKYYTQYLHLSKASVTEGQAIARGTELGISGNTGASTGPHLHLEIKKQALGGAWTSVDPYGWQGTGTDPYLREVNDNLWLQASTSNTVVGRVTDSAGNGIAGVPVVIEAQLASSILTVTDGTGAYTFGALTAGQDYSVAIQENAAVSDQSGAQVLNLSGQQTQNFSLAVDPISPSVTRQPRNAVVRGTVNVAFDSAFAGSAPLSYQWQVSSDSGMTWEDLQSSAIYSGVESASLELLQTEVSMDGNHYRCVATNLAGIAKSEPAILSILAEPVGFSEPVGLQFGVGVAAEIHIETTPVSEGASYDWLLNNAIIATTSIPVLTIPSFGPENAGTYRLVVREAQGDSYSNPFVIQVTGLTYASWLEFKLGAGNTPEDPGLARMGSALGDGTENILKYAFGKGPSETAPSVLPSAYWTGTGVNKRLGIEFQRIFQPLDIRYKIEASGNLSDWREVTSQMTQVDESSVGQDGLSERVRFQCPVALGQSGSEDWRFLRIGVVDLLGSSDVSESLSLVDGLDQQIALATPGSENATYEWYRDGTKIATTSDPSVPVTSFSPAQSGAYKVIIREPSGATKVVSLMVKVTGLTYESWLRHKEGPSATPADPGLARLASARNDGTENILKYAFGKGPNESANEVLPKAMWTGAGADRRLAIKFRRILAPSDITIRVEASANLSDWRDVSAELVPFGVPLTTEDGVSEEVVLQCPATIFQTESNNWRYLRVVVTDPTSATPTVLLSDDFDDNEMNSSLWSVVQNGGTRVVEENAVMKVETTATDKPGTLTTNQIAMPTSKVWTLERRVMLHRDTSRSFLGNNKFYEGWIRFDVNGYEKFALWYCDYDYVGSDPQYVPKHGYILTRDGAHGRLATTGGEITEELAPLILDQWFDEELFYNPTSGVLRYSINGNVLREFNVGQVSQLGSTVDLAIRFQSYGWWSPHYQHFDDFKLEVGP